MPDQVKREVNLILPMSENMELVAAHTASSLAELMAFEENDIDALQFALIETCINAFEHSKSDDKRVFITFMMRDDALEFSVRDNGVGFRPERPTRKRGSLTGSLRKRGWGLDLIENLMDTVNVESNSKGTTITMTKNKCAQNQN